MVQKSKAERCGRERSRYSPDLRAVEKTVLFTGADEEADAEAEAEVELLAGLLLEEALEEAGAGAAFLAAGAAAAGFCAAGSFALRMSINNNVIEEHK
mgnify:CR=1 FL=1